MKRDKFEELWNDTMKTCHQLGVVKGGEYAHGNDRLDNFKRNAAANGTTPFQVWAIYAGKHWDSILTFIRDDAHGLTRPRSESIEGRAQDMIVYLVLFIALYREWSVEQKRAAHSEDIKKAVEITRVEPAGEKPLSAVISPLDSLPVSSEIKGIQELSEVLAKKQADQMNAQLSQLGSRGWDLMLIKGAIDRLINSFNSEQGAKVNPNLNKP